LELIIQKAVELGCSEIVPVAMKNCVMKIIPQKAEAKTKRWCAIAESAAKQCGRSIIPTITMPMTFDKALEYGAQLEEKLLPYENQRGMEHTREVMQACRGYKSIGIWIGPEGGYALEEVEKATAAGWKPISLGQRILRTETAGMAALAMLVYVLDE
jgi:16S rRNA (uracil1498-N3)-methyltransferase